MPLTDAESQRIDTAMHEIQAELDVYQTLLFCFLLNAMAASGRMEMLDALLEQARFLVENRQPTGISRETAEYQRTMTLQAFDRVLENLHQARAAMERVDRGVN